MAAQKRKSVLVEPSAKRRKLDNEVTTSKDRKLRDTTHVSKKYSRLRKEMHTISTKSKRLSASMSINKPSAPSSRSKQAQKRSSRILNELKKKTIRTGSMKRSSLKSTGKLSPIKTPPKSSKISLASHKKSTKCSSKMCCSGNGKPNLVKSKSSRDKQKMSSMDGNKCSSRVVGSSRSALRVKATKNMRCSVIKSMNGNCRKARTTQNGRVLRSSSTGAKNQSSKNLCPKNSAFHKTEKTRLETDEKACDAKQEKMTTRSKATVPNKSPVTPWQEQLRFKKTAGVSPEEVGHCLSEPPYTVRGHQNRRSLRLQQSSNVPTESLCNKYINQDCILAAKRHPEMKKVPHVKTEKPTPVLQKTEQKSMKNECRNKGKEISDTEQVAPLKGKKSMAELKSTDLTASRTESRQSNNVNSNLQEFKNELNSMISCPATSTCGVIGKEKAVPQNGKSSAKAKRTLPPSASAKPADRQDDATKSKKISILELCEEIAGEIESDTVEVKKESPSSEYEREEGKGNTTAGEIPKTAASTEEKTTRISQCKRFFPSKRMPVKCTVNGRHSVGNKNSKWTKIKFKKASHARQSISNTSNIPKPIPFNSSISEGQRVIAEELHLAQAQEKRTQSQNSRHDRKVNPTSFNGILAKEETAHPEQPVRTVENGLLERKHPEPTPNKSFNLKLDSSTENTPVKIVAVQPSAKQVRQDVAEASSQGPAPKQLVRTLFPDKTSGTNESRTHVPSISLTSKCGDFPSTEEYVKKLKDAAKDSDKQLIIDAGQKRFGAISCNICGMLYTAANHEDETQHLFFHNQFISAVKYVVLLIKHQQCGSEEELITVPHFLEGFTSDTHSLATYYPL